MICLTLPLIHWKCREIVHKNKTLFFGKTLQSDVSEAIACRCSWKQVFLKILQNLQESTCVGVCLNKVAGLKVFTAGFHYSFFTEHTQENATFLQSSTPNKARLWSMINISNHVSISLNPFLANFSSTNLLQTSENCRFSYVFRVYGNGSLAETG